LHDVPAGIEHSIVLQAHEIVQSTAHTEGALATNTAVGCGRDASLSDNLLLALEVASDAPPIALLVAEPAFEIFLGRWAVLHLELFNGLSARFRSKADLIRRGREPRDHLGGCHVFNICRFEEMTHALLLEGVSLLLEPLMKPVWVLDARHWVHALLEGCWDSHDFHDRATETLFVIVPVEKAAQVNLLDPLVLGPLPDVAKLGILVLEAENLDWDGSLGDFGLQGLLADDKSHIKTLVFGHVAPEGLLQAASTSQGRALLACTLLQSFRDHSGLTDEVNKLLLVNIFSFRLEDVIPAVSDLTAGIITLLQRLAFQEFCEDLRLENLDDFQFTSTLELKALQLRDLA